MTQDKLSKNEDEIVKQKRNTQKQLQMIIISVMTKKKYTVTFS